MAGCREREEQTCGSGGDGGGEERGEGWGRGSGWVDVMSDPFHDLSIGIAGSYRSDRRDKN